MARKFLNPNMVEGNLKYNEKEGNIMNVAVIACMDEDAKIVGIKLGILGSLITKHNSGKPELFPESTRNIIDNNRDTIINAFKNVADKLGCVFGACSHPGCGAASAQGFNENESKTATSKLYNDSYFGHLPIADEPLLAGKINGLSVYGYMGRSVEDHHHKAEWLDFTVGGGISYEEDKKRSLGGKALIVSADWVTYALDAGVSENDIKEILKVQLKIAVEIAPEIKKKYQGKEDFIRTFDASESRADKCLAKEIAERNKRIVNEVIREFSG